MPVEFLTAEQEKRYGRYAGELTPEQLAGYFHLDERDRAVIRVRRGRQARLGFALQLGTVRFLGTFLARPSEVPNTVLDYSARQLKLADPRTCLEGYDERQTHWAHVREIRRRYGYREFNEQPGHFRLVRWLYTRAWNTAERPSVLFDLATARLIERKILLPGGSTLARLVARIRDRAAARLWRILSHASNPEQRDRLEALLLAPEEGHPSSLDRLRRAPTRVNADGLVEALRRLNEARNLGVVGLDFSSVPPGRMAALARHASVVRAQAIARMSEERRVATLVAFAHTLEIRACDDALDLFNLLVSELLSDAERAGRKERLRTLPSLDEAALQVSEASLIITDLDHTNLKKVRAMIFERTPREELLASANLIQSIAHARDDRQHYDELLSRYQTVRRFLPVLMDTFEFLGTDPEHPVLGAIQALRRLEGTRGRHLDVNEVPLNVVNMPWRRLVLEPDGQVDRRAYTLCVVDRLLDGLNRRDVFVERSKRWSDPRKLLLRGSEWEKARPQVLRVLGVPPVFEVALETISNELDTAYRRTSEGLPTNTAARIEEQEGLDRFIVTPLDALDEPGSLVHLREEVAGLLPRVDLPDVLLEVDAWTGFTQAFSHASEGEARVDDLDTSICAALVAESCNVGFEPLVRAEVPSLTRDRLTWVAQNYFRGETIRRANARLVEYQTKIPLAKHWGGGEVASADGIRFVVPVRSLHAGPSRKYFGGNRGVTYYNFTSNQCVGFHGFVIPGTIRDSIYILNGLLEHETALDPHQIITDTAAYSDLVFGLFRLLGYQFSPRIKGLGDARFWRIDRKADYGVLNGIARHRINTKVISPHWDDMLRVAGSLVRGSTSASELIRSIQPKGEPSNLARAIAEFGRIPKTIHLLTYVDDEMYRRRTLTQLNRQESRHSLARSLFHGKRGELRQAYREGQEDQLEALGLVVNAIVLWNTRYIAAALEHVRAEGIQIAVEDAARLLPFVHEHINLHGRYHFHLSEEVQRGEMRQLNESAEARWVVQI